MDLPLIFFFFKLFYIFLIKIKKKKDKKHPTYPTTHSLSIPYIIFRFKLDLGTPSLDRYRRHGRTSFPPLDTTKHSFLFRSSSSNMNKWFFCKLPKHSNYNKITQEQYISTNLIFLDLKNKNTFSKFAKSKTLKLRIKLSKSSNKISKNSIF